jgi:hypothetical protein
MFAVRRSAVYLTKTDIGIARGPENQSDARLVMQGIG